MENDQATLNDQNDVVDTTAAPAAAAPEPSMDDTMRATLASIKERDTEANDGQKADRARDQKGKFAKEKPQQAAPAADTAKPAAADSPKPADQTAPAAAAPATPATAPAAPVSTLQPPAGFTPAAKAEFANASPVIQQEILKRENDFHKGMQQYKQAADYGHAMYKAIQPYESTIKSWNTTPDKAVEALFAADHKLTHGSPQEKMQAFAALAKGYGIDLSQGLPAPQAVDPNVEYLQRQNQSAIQAAQAAAQQVQQLQAKFAEQEKSQLNSEIEQAKQGKPHFDELRFEIGTILQSALDRNQPITLDQAYEAALWQSPTHRSALLAKQREEFAAEEARKRAEEAEKAAAARKAASVNVPKRGSLPAQKPVGTMEDTMRATLSQIRGA